MGAAPTPLAQAIRDLRKQYGSHDKLAAAVGTSRNTVIRWEKGGFPRDFVDELSRLGIPDGLLVEQRPAPVQPAPVALMAEALENQRAMRVDLEQLSDAVASLARDLATLVAQQAEQPESRNTPKKRAGG